MAGKKNIVNKQVFYLIIYIIVEKEQFLKLLGKRIVFLRKQKGLSQLELARRCGKSPQSIERVENGKVNPSAFQLLIIANGLKVSANELLLFEQLL